VEIKTQTPAVDASDLLSQPDRQPWRASNWWVAALCVMLSLLAVMPFYFMGRAADGSKQWRLQMPVTHDMHLHLEQMKSFYNGLTAGRIYPRWEEDTNRGFGAATTSYYPPGIYYLTSAFYALSHDWIVTLLCTHLLMMIASAAALYVYIRQFVTRRGAILAMAAYIFLPYHLLDQYQRGAMAELLGFIWMPVMLLFGERLFRRPGDWKATKLPSLSSSPLVNLVGLAATYAAFLWSHPPTAYQFSLAFGIYVLLLTTMRKHWLGLISVAVAIVLGVTLAAAYLYPAAAEQNFIRHEYVTETWPYHTTYIFVHHLPYSLFGGFFRLLDGIWIFGAVLIPLSAAAILGLARHSLKPVTLEQSFLWMLMGCFATFMMIKASEPLGRLIPKIDIGVFTWRMFGITTLAVALLTGVCAHLMSERVVRRTSNRTIFAALVGLIVIGGGVFTIATVFSPMVHAPVFTPAGEHVNFATIPHDAPAEPLDLPWLDKAMLASGNGEVRVEDWRPEVRRMQVVLREPDVLIIRTFNFPGWSATVDGEPVTIITGEELSEITLDLPAGSHRVDLEFLDTPIRRRAERITLAAFVLLCGLSLVAVFKRSSQQHRQRM
jgi:hypothetical protein